MRRQALARPGLFAAVVIVAAPMALAALTTLGCRVRDRGQAAG
ncbi:hypothetical protein [Nocardia uniformis]|nr:hypothetical protein [Nocardia uniformis]